MVAINVPVDADKNAKPDSAIQNGTLEEPPIAKRSSTDVLFLILFVITFVAWVSRSIYLLYEFKMYDRSGYYVSSWLTRNWPPILGGIVVIIITLMFSMGRFMTQFFWINIVLLHGIFLAGALHISPVWSYTHIVVPKNRTIAIISGSVLVLLFCTVVFMRRRISWALNVIKEGSRPVIENPAIAFFPLIPCMVQLHVIAFTFMFAMFLWIYEMQIDSIINIAMFVWVMVFFVDFSKMSLAGGFKTWFWTYNNDPESSSFELSESFETTLTYHSGTIAFGSLALNILRIPRIILGVGVDKDGCGLFMCFRYTLSYFERFLRRFNPNAYIMCAIHGKDLWASGSDAHELISPHFMRYFLVNCVTGVIFGFSKILVAVATAAVAYFKVFPSFGYEVWILTISAYLIADMFFSIYSTSIDTMILCHLEDFEDRNGNNRSTPYMSHQMMEVLESDTTAASFYADLKQDCQLICGKCIAGLRLLLCSGPGKGVTDEDIPEIATVPRPERRVSI